MTGSIARAGSASRVFVVAMFFVLMGCSGRSGDAARVANQILTDSGTMFMVGQADVAAATDFGRRQISQKEYEDMLCAAKAGFIKFTDDKNFADGKFRGFDDYFSRAKSGIMRHIVTEITPLGEKVTKDFKDNDWSKAEEQKNETAQWIKITPMAISVDRVVEDKTLEKGADRYRVIGVVVDSHFTKDGAELNNACSATPVTTDFISQQKWRLLLKWDSFSNKWKLIERDVSTGNRDFQSDNVSAMLSRLGV